MKMSENKRRTVVYGIIVTLITGILVGAKIMSVANENEHVKTMHLFEMEVISERECDFNSMLYDM